VSGRERRDLPRIDHRFETICLAVEQPEPAATQAGAARLDHGQCGAHGDSCIERVAALTQDFHTRFGGELMRAGDARFAGPSYLIGVNCQRQYQQR
jgi:hypothetical protein